MNLLDLGKAEDAKKYINDFEIPGQPKIEWVILASGRKIEFATISDADAILVANMLHDIQLETERRFAVETDQIQ